MNLTAAHVDVDQFDERTADQVKDLFDRHGTEEKVEIGLQIAQRTLRPLLVA